MDGDLLATLDATMVEREIRMEAEFQTGHSLLRPARGV